MDNWLWRSGDVTLVFFGLTFIAVALGRYVAHLLSFGDIGIVTSMAVATLVWYGMAYFALMKQ